MTSMRLGVVSSLEHGPEDILKKAAKLGFPTVQVTCWNQDCLTPENAEALVKASERYGVEVTTIWTGTPGDKVWDFLQGPSTIGIVPASRRNAAIRALCKGADFAEWTGVPSITTHAGFIPDDPATDAYRSVLGAIKLVAEYCQAKGLEFWFETGQETPVTLLRVIEDCGTGNLGVNLDPANLLMYGKANPVDALDVFGQYVRGVHAKDGEYPTNGRELGVEKPLGEGRVGFPTLLKKLDALGYDGALTIEREISGPRQVADIKAGKAFLEGILATL